MICCRCWLQSFSFISKSNESKSGILTYIRAMNQCLLLLEWIDKILTAFFTVHVFGMMPIKHKLRSIFPAFLNWVLWSWLVLPVVFREFYISDFEVHCCTFVVIGNCASLWKSFLYFLDPRKQSLKVRDHFIKFWWRTNFLNPKDYFKRRPYSTSWRKVSSNTSRQSSRLGEKIQGGGHTPTPSLKISGGGGGHLKKFSPTCGRKGPPHPPLNFFLLLP
jgi:hypothetical protein